MHHRSPGDVVALTSLVRDIQLAYPDKFQVDVHTSVMSLWDNNPYITPLRTNKKIRKEVQFLKMQYGEGIKEQKFRPIHFSNYFHEDFKRQTGINVPPQLPYPDLHLSDEEKQPLLDRRYWIVLAGGKSDYPIKVWGSDRYQEVAKALSSRGLGVVQMGSNEKGHWHPPLRGVLNLVGKTTIRDMIRLIYHADGVICGITAAMHIAAALHRPCVCIAGGREAWWWEGYVRENKGLQNADKLIVPHKYLHTIGLLDCCRTHGCWKNKVTSDNPSVNCKLPIQYPARAIPKCLDMITVDHVLGAVMDYYNDGTLPPIGEPPKVVDEQPTTAPAAKSEPAESDPFLSLFDIPADKSASEDKAKPDSSRKVKKHTKAQLRIPAHVVPQLAKGAKLQGRGKNATIPAATSPTVNGSPNIPDTIFDHEDIGGKFTIFVLLYGPEKYHSMHVQCINAILGTVPKDRMDLRIGSNALNDKSVEFVEDLCRKGICTKHYRHKENAWKYPVMREMFHDPDHPITTKWVIWFDDDSIADRDINWLKITSQAIIKHHKPDNVHCFGSKFFSSMSDVQRKWYESRPWHKGKQWRMLNGTPSPNGDKVIFVTGGWWVMSAEAIKKADIPDPLLTHNGGDIQIGEALYQNDMNIKQFNNKKTIVNTSGAAPQRGEKQPHFGSQKWQDKYLEGAKRQQQEAACA